MRSDNFPAKFTSKILMRSEFSRKIYFKNLTHLLQKIRWPRKNERMGDSHYSKSPQVYDSNSPQDSNSQQDSNSPQECSSQEYSPQVYMFSKKWMYSITFLEK